MAADYANLTDAIERLIDAKLRPRSMTSSDDAALNGALLLRDAERIDAARRSLVGAVESAAGGRRCGKCASPAQVAVPPTPGDHSHIVVSGAAGRLLRDVAVTTYVCTSCGYVEEWVDDPADLRRLIADRNPDRGDARPGDAEADPPANAEPDLRAPVAAPSGSRPSRRAADRA